MKFSLGRRHDVADLETQTEWSYVDRSEDSREQSKFLKNVWLLIGWLVD